MALTKTPICNFGEKAKDFNLKSIENKQLSLKNVRGENGTLIMFICNHCPYVKAIIKDLVDDVKFLENLGIKSVGIMSNDVKNYPDDSFENMISFSRLHEFSFPYLIDETQDVAKKYGAVCTPDFYCIQKNLGYRQPHIPSLHFAFHQLYKEKKNHVILKKKSYFQKNLQDNFLHRLTLYRLILHPSLLKTLHH